MYRDGRLVKQGHSFSEREILKLAGVEFRAIHDADVEATDWHFPERLEDVVGGSE